MPITETPYPILSLFACSVINVTGVPPQPLDAMPNEAGQAEKSRGEDTTPKSLPKGVVLGKDGKPCRSCTSFGAWAAMAKQDNSSPSITSATTTPAQSTSSLSSLSSPPPDCPPDVEQLGRSSWTLLHSIAANYPEKPTLNQQTDTRQFMYMFGRIYPCWVCADDFKAWMKEGNAPKVSSRQEFGEWMCRAHNAVNVKLGKPTFDCNRWEERWRTGWKDGRCD